MTLLETHNRWTSLFMWCFFIYYLFVMICLSFYYQFRTGWLMKDSYWRLGVICRTSSPSFMVWFMGFSWQRLVICLVLNLLVNWLYFTASSKMLSNIQYSATFRSIFYRITIISLFQAQIQPSSGLKSTFLRSFFYTAISKPLLRIIPHLQQLLQ